MSTSQPFMEINGRKIGPGYPVYIIAELSANHHGRYEDAVALIEAATKAGADAIKVQTYTADTLTLDVDSDLFRHGEDSPWANRSLYDLYQEAYMPWEWQPDLQSVARKLGIDFFSTPFDPTAVEFLDAMQVPAFKVASFEVVDLPLIRRIAATGKPIIMSTGMASLEEIEEAVDTARSHGAGPIALLKCTSAYPAAPDEMNLRTIPDMAQRFHVPVGVSDHTLGIAVPAVAVSLGASLVEKHFTLSRSIPGPDSAFSLEPQEFEEMVEAVRTAEQALGKINYEITEREIGSRAFRRSLFVVKDMNAGDRFNEQNVRSIRPAQGLQPKHLEQVLNRTAARDIRRGTPLSWDLVA